MPSLQGAPEKYIQGQHLHQKHQQQQQQARVFSPDKAYQDGADQIQQQQQEAPVNTKRGMPNIAFGTRKDELRPQTKRRRPTRQLNDENAPRHAPAKLPRVARMTAEELRRRPQATSPVAPGASHAHGACDALRGHFATSSRAYIQPMHCDVFFRKVVQGVNQPIPFPGFRISDMVGCSQRASCPCSPCL